MFSSFEFGLYFFKKQITMFINQKKKNLDSSEGRIWYDVNSFDW